jgi:hypothetical protein
MLCITRIIYHYTCESNVNCEFHLESILGRTLFSLKIDRAYIKSYFSVLRTITNYTAYVRVSRKILRDFFLFQNQSFYMKKSSNSIYYEPLSNSRSQIRRSLRNSDINNISKHCLTHSIVGYGW